MKLALGVLRAVVVIPITVYLWYQVLVRVEASELMWFLFWAYVPVIFLIVVIEKLIEKD